jgi:hypothetical protein
MIPDRTTSLIIGLGVAAALLLGVWFHGRATGINRGEAKLEAKANQLMGCEIVGSTLAAALNEVNARAEQAKRDAAAQAEYAAQAVRQADKDRAEYEKRIDGIVSDLTKAKRAPACRAQLEQPLCVELH